MKKISLISVVTFVALVLLVSVGHTQGPKKTITLPNGEVVCDLNGEWDALFHPYGDWSEFEDQTDVLNITQKGATFFGVKKIGTTYVVKGEKSIIGELTKDGFKNVQVQTGTGYVDCTCKMSEDRNKIILDADNKIKVTLTRR